jgi:hypothetical protein
MKPPRLQRANKLLCAALLGAVLQPARTTAQTIAVPSNPQSTPTAPTVDKGAAGSITGRVVAESGEPLAQVTVFLSSRNGSASSQRTATTDDEGSFVFADLPPGIYNVITSLPGYYSETAAQGEAAPAGLRPGDSATIKLTKGGIITGTVTDLNGTPIVALPVRAYHVRVLESDSTPAVLSLSPLGYQTQTDDRGIYRIFGLMPGIYVVATGGAGIGPFSPYEGDAPTFYPSSTRDTAAEVAVRAGQEASGIDIRYREERGQSLSGELQLPADLRDLSVGANIQLIHSASGAIMATAFASPRGVGRGFQLDGVADGDYELRATLTTPDGAARSSAPLRVSVRGADVTGLRLVLAPLSTLSGRLVVETPPTALRESELCRAAAPAPRLLAQEVLLTARLDEERAAAAPRRPGQFTRSTSWPDETGAFTLRNLEGGHYRLQIRPLDESLYVRSVQLPAPASTAAGNTPRIANAQPPARTGPTGVTTQTRATGSGGAGRYSVTLGAGQQVSGIVVRIAYGAALLSGRLTAPESFEQTERAAAAAPAGRARLYLIPAEAERADDPFSYAETSAAIDGSFVFRNIAPGRYLLAIRPSAAATQTPEGFSFGNTAGRAALRREAEAARLAFDLQPCQRLSGVALPFRPSAAIKE